jgi:hemerythrin-like domain-containing protein
MDEQTKVGALLHGEHLKSIEAMQNLEDFVLRHAPGRPPQAGDGETREILQSLLGDLVGEIDRHFAFEESRIFPLLMERGHQGVVFMLTEEHEIIRPLALELKQEAETALAAGGFAPQAWKAFHERAIEFCERETFHIQKEEMGLLGSLPFLLDNDTDAQLAELYASGNG